MEAIVRRNWIFARRNNIITLAWLTPVLSVVFTWVLSIVEDGPISDILGLGRLSMFAQFAVVMVYFFVNALVSWIVAAYLASREFEDKHLSLLRLTSVTPAQLYFGHLRTIANIMLPQIVVFHAGIAVFYIATNPDIFREGEVSIAMFVGVLFMNLLNTYAISTVILPAIYGKAALFITFGALVSLVAVPTNFIFFFIADDLGVPLFVLPLAVIAFFALMGFLTVLWGKRRWHAEWR
jgi:hypothetical protein